MTDRFGKCCLGIFGLQKKYDTKINSNCVSVSRNEKKNCRRRRIVMFGVARWSVSEKKFGHHH